MFPKTNIDLMMPSKVLFFIAIILVVGLFVLFKSRQPKLIDEDITIDDAIEEIEPLRRSKYNLYNEIELFMERQTNYVMS
jgi:hypothetical protein